MEIERLKAKVRNRVEAQKQEFIQLSLKIHANPELGFREGKASSWLGSYLGSNGFQVAKCIAGLPTELRWLLKIKKPRINLWIIQSSLCVVIMAYAFC